MKKFVRLFKLIGIPFLIAIGIYCFIRFIWLNEPKNDFSFTQINTEEYLNIYYNLEEAVIFVAKEDSENKSGYEQIIRNQFTGKKVKVYYYNITNLNNQELVNFEAATGLIDVKYQLPMLVYTLNGEIISLLEGDQDSYSVADFIEQNNIR